MTTDTRTERRLSSRSRKIVLALHVISSVGWLGINVGNLSLALVGLFTENPERQRFAIGGMGLLADTLLIPISLLAFGTGVWLSLGTRWGLLRHRWVLIKFMLTLIAVVLIPLSLLPGIHALVAHVSATPAGTLADTGKYATDIISAGCVSTAMYTTNTVLSVFKPFGRTKIGRRRQAQPGRARPVS